MTDDLYSFDDIVEEMVTRGIRRDGASESKLMDWTKPLWWARERPEDASPQSPRKILFLIHPIPVPDGLNPAVFAVHTCSCCNEVAAVHLSVLVNSEDESRESPVSEYFSTLSHWPGLDSALRLHRTISSELFTFEKVHS